MRIELDGIEHAYPNGFCLQVDHLELPAGSVHAIMGPNGSGKSTLMRILALIEAAQTGRISIDGRALDTGNTLALRRRICLVDQSPYMLRGTLLKNLEFGLRIRNVSWCERRERALAALDLVDLRPQAEQRAELLSGGQAQRLALARALILEPDLLLLDEPTANMDRNSREMVERLLRELPLRGTSLVIATHDRAQAGRLNARLLRADQGRILAEYRRRSGRRTQTRNPQGDPQMIAYFEQARQTILDHIQAMPAQEVPLDQAAGRVLAQDVHARWDLPHWDNSAMDGFAVRAADASEAASLNVTGFLPAGATAQGLHLEPGTAIRIMTGAPVPAGADAIVPVEDVSEDGDRIQVERAAQVGAHIRVQGEDMQRGDQVLQAGTRLHAPHISLLASLGYVQAPVYRRPRVAVLSTGDELVDLGDEPGPGQLINSNSVSIAAALREAGAEPVMLGIARDNRENMRSMIALGLRADALVTTAGVSAGDLDLVRVMLEEAGVRQLFYNLHIKPGRPTAFGLAGGVPVFSLPGNPVSAMLTFEAFVRPAVLAMGGRRDCLRPLLQARLESPINKKPGRLEFVRLQVRRDADGQLLARSAGNQNTGILRTMVEARAIGVLPENAGALGPGDLLSLFLLYPDESLEEMTDA